MEDKILLFIPMYNCEKQIIRVLNQLDREILEYIDRILIVNNRSTDNGEKAVSVYCSDHPELPVVLVRNDENYGLGGSHKVAFNYALTNNFDYIIVLHGDDQGDIHDFLPLLSSKQYREYDCCLGSRFMKGSVLKGYSFIRIFGNRVFNIIFSVAMRKRIYDLGSGLNMYNVQMLKSKYYIKYSDHLTFNCFMLLAVKCYDQKSIFLPVSWREDDQVSNVKFIKQSFQTLKIALSYLFMNKKYLEDEHRINVIEDYTCKEIYTNNCDKE